MDTKKISPCIFCGTETEEQHTTSIGTIYIHSECLVDLEQILSLTGEELEETNADLKVAKMAVSAKV